MKSKKMSLTPSISGSIDGVHVSPSLRQLKTTSPRYMPRRAMSHLAQARDPSDTTAASYVVTSTKVTSRSYRRVSSRGTSRMTKEKSSSVKSPKRMMMAPKKSVYCSTEGHASPKILTCSDSRRLPRWTRTSCWTPITTQGWESMQTLAVR